MKITILSIAMLMSTFLSINIAACQDKIIHLYEGEIPNSISNDKEKEKIEISNIKRISNVQTPTLETFFPSKRNNNGKSVVICPGGGYGILAYDWEGTEIAQWFNSKGYTAFVLKYRLPIAKTVTNKNEVPLQDAKRAIQIVRKNASLWGLDENNIGIMGFSAGGHLASTLGTHFNIDTNIKDDSYKSVSARPDFMILMYPVVTMKEKYTHMGSRNALLGKNPSEEKITFYSNELQVTADTPPTFIVHSTDDNAVPVENSLLFYKALKENNVPVEIHLYPTGGHGFGLALEYPHLKAWPKLLDEWLQFIDKDKK
ncbi:alpha/beta hydrolase [Joostella sp.]|uniref:alpha/beta hydrolase n=1 Tax=Joostella sp. TaxID=2231138 RepID=UPI003A928682